MARAWDVLMKRFGYTRYVSEGGDHGSVISGGPRVARGLHAQRRAPILLCWQACPLQPRPSPEKHLQQDGSLSHPCQTDEVPQCFQTNIDLMHRGADQLASHRKLVLPAKILLALAQAKAVVSSFCGLFHGFHVRSALKDSSGSPEPLYFAPT